MKTKNKLICWLWKQVWEYRFDPKLKVIEVTSWRSALIDDKGYIRMRVTVMFHIWKDIYI